MTIIGYTYEADHHCVECTQKRSNAKKFIRKPMDHWRTGKDRNGLPFDATDREGNYIHPIFSTDELPCDISDENGGYSPVCCGDCGAVIRERETTPQ